MVLDIIFFVLSLLLVIKGATLATRYAVALAESFRLSKYVVGFIVVAVISILPEMFIAINAAIAGTPSFALGTLFGSNIADLTLVFALIVFLSGRAIKVESIILKNNRAYPFVLLLPIVLGFDGHFSRVEGLALIIAGAIFYFLAFKNGVDDSLPKMNASGRVKTVALLLGSVTLLLFGSYATVVSATNVAHALGVSAVLIGMLIVGLGTTMPELFFSLKSVRKRHYSMAVGDILGTVLADATVVVGVLALMGPFHFPQKIIYITGLLMVGTAVLLFVFLRSGRRLSKKEAVVLLFVWVLFVIIEFVANRIYPQME